MTVTRFDSKERLLARAKRYVESPEFFLDHADEATALLIRALKHADAELRENIKLLLTCFGDKERLAANLSTTLRDPDKDEDERRAAALTLSVIAPHLTDRRALAEDLLKDTTSQDVELRWHATCALGWDGNRDAVLALIDRLYDDDTRVQETAVFALTNLRDDRVLGLLVDRLERGSIEQQRSILFNLWRFYSKQEQAAEVYLRYLEHEDADLRFEALALLGQLTNVADHVDAIRPLLRDGQQRVRRLALRTLAELDTVKLRSLRQDVLAMLEDPNMEIKRLAHEILDRVDS
jgi:HEAT repeat protein